MTTRLSRFVGKLSLLLAICVFSQVLGPLSLFAQDSVPPRASASSATPAVAEKPSKDLTKAHAAFRKLLSNSKLVGNFTIVGTKKDLTPEEYTISEVIKLDKGDYWMFKVRIKYMKYNLKVSLPLQVKWAGDTPVIVVDGDEIIGLGKFNARVVLHENKYAGTWSHGDHGGHLFGTIERIDAAKKDGAKKDGAKKDGANKDDKPKEKNDKRGKKPSSTNRFDQSNDKD